MKKTAKILSLLLIITLLLSSCSIDTDRIRSFITSHSVLEIKDGIMGDGELDVTIINNAVFMLTSRYKEETDSIDYYLCKFNAKNAKPIDSVLLDNCPVDYPYGLDVNDDGNIVVYGTIEDDMQKDTVDEYCICYSSDTLIQTGEREKYTPSLPEIEADKSPMGLFMNSGESVVSSEYTDIPDRPLRFFYLRSDLDSVILADELDFSIYSSYENIAVGLQNITAEEDDGTQTILVYDFENGVLVNKLTTMAPIEENMTKFIVSVYSDEKYVLFSEEIGETDAEDFQTKYFIWHYRNAGLNEPFESTKRTEKQLEQSNKKLCEQIKESTGINVYINSDKYDFYGEDEDYYLYRNAKPLEVNVMLTRIKAFLDLLPEGFAKEMYTDLNVFEYGGFDIFIGDSIKGTASAYASSFMNNLTIVFGTGASDFRTVAHEFMHIMDTRIEDYLGTDTSFYELWGKYNPDGFEYEGINNDNPSYDYEDYEDWFVSAYSMSTDAEDRAEIFSYLFVDSFSDSPMPDWYKDKKPLKEKTDYLLEMIRKAYPSLKNVKTAQWEKAANSDKELITFL